MRIYFVPLLCLFLFSCKPSNKVVAPESSFETVGNQGSESLNADLDQSKYCASFDLALNGVFTDNFREGTMTWIGGIKGTVEISGVDYNEMTCSYEVTDCALGQISMICNQSAYDTTMDLYTADSIRLGTTVYTRVK